MRKLSAWLRSHPIIAGCIAFLAFCVCLHFFLNWRAERRWQAYATEARARGVKLNLTDFAPPKIPDEENFAALPMMRAIMKPGAKSPMAWPAAGTPSFGDPLKGERLDWDKWQTYFKDAGFISETTDSAPRDVLRALEHYAPQFLEWSEWKTRKQCRFDLDLKAGFATPLPHLGTFHNAAMLFTLRMRAHLALGDSTAAYDDFREGFQAYRTLVEEPTLISGLVRVSALSILFGGVGDGLADHAWSEVELRKIGTDLETVRLWEGYQLSMSSERGYANWLFEYLIAVPLKKRTQLLSGVGFGPRPSLLTTVFVGLVPKRIYRDNQIHSNRYFDELLGTVTGESMRFNPDQPTPSSSENLSALDRYYFLVLHHLVTSAYGGIPKKFASTQTKLDQTRIAIAIERFRITRGALPETLAELVGEFITAIPDDVYGKGPMIYRREEAGKFILYSVGTNRSDDGGAVNAGKSESRQPDLVWPYP